MKPMKLTSLVVMLLVGFSAAAQEEFFDDVYFSSSKEKKKEKTEEKVIQPKKEDATGSSSAIVLASASDSHPAFEENRDVDEYNRRYTSVDVEEPYDEDFDDEDGTYIEELPDNNQKVTKKSERRSDTEYTERIVRYHSPSKITIAGADQVDLYLSDGYYSYGYDTDYSDGNANVNVNINVGNNWGGWYGWNSPWYNNWYDPWYSYSPWWTYSSWYGPRWGFGWQAGAVLGTAAIGAAVTGEVAAIGDTITTIIITRTTTDRRGVQCQAVILPEEVLPVAIAPHHQTVRHLTDHRIVQHL